jgi:hypothetical protein
MRILILLGLTAAILAAVPHSTRDAQAACNYSNDPLSNCGNAINDYANKTFGHQSNSYDDVKTRVDSAKDTLNQCVDCAMDKVEQGANGATSTSTSTSTDDDSQ